MAPTAIKISLRGIPFLTQAAYNNFDLVNGYMASIDGWLWGHPDIGIKNRLQAIRVDPQFKQCMVHTPLAAQNPVPPAIQPFLLKLDRIAYDIKELAGNAYICTPITGNVTKTLSTANNATRTALDGLIDQCVVVSENDTAAPIFTVANLPNPNSTYRIDRENLSAAPAPRYWTYRIQIGAATHGGILLQTNVEFTLDSVRNAMKASVASCPQLAAGFYVRLSAPPWLTAILAA